MVYPRFPNRHNFRVFTERPQIRPHIIRSRLQIVGMPSHHRVYLLMYLSQSYCFATTDQVCANGNHPRNAGGLRALQESGNFIRKIRKSQVRVCIVKRFHSAAVCPPEASVTIV